MTTDKLVLNISKINISPDSTRLKYSQDERGKQVDVTVIGNDGSTAYDLTGKKIIFSEIKDGGKIIIDDEISHFIRTADNDKIGKFTYVFVDQTYQQSGEAHFEFTTDIEHVDTTINFDISIVNSAQLKPDNTSYVSSLIALEAHYRATISNADAQTQNLINSLIDKIDQAISNGQRDVANELSDARAKLQSIQDQENKLIASWTTELNTQKQNFANLESQWQAQSKAISDDYASKKEKIESDAQSQHNSIQAAADQQLKNNQSANDAEIADVKKQLADELAKVEADKTTAIQGITDARDKAISDATDKLNANLRSLQEDYNTWKTSAVGDFQAKLDKLTRQLNTDETDQASLKQAIDSAKEAVSKIHDVDFTVYAHKSDLGNYYTKSQTDQKLGQKITFVKCDSPQAAHDVSMRPAADGSIVLGVYDMNDEPSQAVVGDQKINIEWLYNHLTDLSTQVSGLSNLQSLINGKANSADVYTKSDTDNIVNNLKELIDNAGKVKTVDGIQPDGKGDIQTDHYTKSQADQKLGQKITFVKCDSPQAAHDASTKPAADGSIVLGVYDMNDEPSQAVVGDQKINIEWLYNHLNDLSTQVSGLSSLQSLIAGKADSATVYTKTQVDQMIANAGKVKTVNNVQPDSSGNINIPAPDLSGKANQSDLNNTNNRVAAIETEYMKKPTVISKADYDKLATKDPNTLYEITE